MFGVIDYGVGNVGSVVNMLKRVGAVARVVAKPTELAGATALVLPGVGHFDAGMTNLRDGGWIDPLSEAVRSRGVPILGICLGMQLLTRRSDEGKLPGLGWLAAETKRFTFGDAERALVLPHMGWNEVTSVDRVLFAGFDGPPRFYFVHTYHVVCEDPTDEAASCVYGPKFTAAVRRGNVFGAQFHPEKSHKFGQTFMRNFVAAVHGSDNTIGAA